MNRVSAYVTPPSQTTTSRLTVSKYSSNLARQWPLNASPTSLDHELGVHLSVHSITASKLISTCPQLPPPSASPYSPYHSLQVRLQTHSVIASQFIAKGIRSRCGETVKLGGRLPNINIPPYLAWHPKGILQTDRFWIEECRKRVRGYDGVPGRDGPQTAWIYECFARLREQPHKLRRSVKTRTESMGPRAGKDRGCISYNEMMFIYPGVCQKYTPCRSVRLWYFCILIPPRAASPGQTEWWWWDTEFSATTASKCI